MGPIILQIRMIAFFHPNYFFWSKYFFYHPGHHPMKYPGVILALGLGLRLWKAIALLPVPRSSIFVRQRAILLSSWVPRPSILLAPAILLTVSDNSQKLIGFRFFKAVLNDFWHHPVHHPVRTILVSSCRYGSDFSGSSILVDLGASILASSCHPQGPHLPSWHHPAKFVFKKCQIQKVGGFCFVDQNLRSIILQIGWLS